MAKIETDISKEDVIRVAILKEGTIKTASRITLQFFTERNIKIKDFKEGFDALRGIALNIPNILNSEENLKLNLDRIGSILINLKSKLKGIKTNGKDRSMIDVINYLIVAYGRILTQFNENHSKSILSILTNEYLPAIEVGKSILRNL